MIFPVREKGNIVSQLELGRTAQETKAIQHIYPNRASTPDQLHSTFLAAFSTKPLHLTARVEPTKKENISSVLEKIPISPLLFIPHTYP